jgi:hypothetical protein
MRIEDLVRSGFKFQLGSEEFEHPEDAKLRRFKDKTIFIMSVLVVSSAFIYCSWRLIKSPEQGWPLAINSSIISGLLGYLVGKKVN